MEYQIIAQTEDCISVDIYGGASISIACQQVVELARTEGKKVTFKFNDVPLAAQPDSTADFLVQEYHATIDKQYEEWKNSTAGKEYAKKRKQEVKQLQQELDNMIRQLPAALESVTTTLNWLSAFASKNDDREVYVDRNYLAVKLEQAGWVRSAEVGKDPQYFKGNKMGMARYIVGQAIDNLRIGMPIHPILSSFVEKYNQP